MLVFFHDHGRRLLLLHPSLRQGRRSHSSVAQKTSVDDRIMMESSGKFRIAEYISARIIRSGLPVKSLTAPGDNIIFRSSSANDTARGGPSLLCSIAAGLLNPWGFSPLLGQKSPPPLPSSKDTGGWCLTVPVALPSRRNRDNPAQSLASC